MFGLTISVKPVLIIWGRVVLLRSCRITLLPPGNMTQIIQIRNRSSALVDLDHEVGIDDLPETLNTIFGIRAGVEHISRYLR